MFCFAASVELRVLRSTFINHTPTKLDRTNEKVFVNHYILWKRTELTMKNKSMKYEHYCLSLMIDTRYAFSVLKKMCVYIKNVV